MIKFDSVDQDFSQFNKNLVNNVDPYSQIENDETQRAEYPNKNYLEDAETNKTSAIPNFMPNILPDDEFAEGINSLDLKQREVFNVVHRWAKDFVKYGRYNFEPVHTFFSGRGGTKNPIW